MVLTVTPFLTTPSRRLGLVDHLGAPLAADPTIAQPDGESVFRASRHAGQREDGGEGRRQKGSVHVLSPGILRMGVGPRPSSATVARSVQGHLAAVTSADARYCDGGALALTCIEIRQRRLAKMQSGMLSVNASVAGTVAACGCVCPRMARTAGAWGAVPWRTP